MYEKKGIINLDGRALIVKVYCNGKHDSNNKNISFTVKNENNGIYEERYRGNLEDLKNRKNFDIILNNAKIINNCSLNNKKSNEDKYYANYESISDPEKIY